MSLPPEKDLSLEVQNEALREEIRQLRVGQVAAQAEQARSDDREEQQARFRTVFENSPFGQKIITPDLVIRQANQAVLEMLDCTSMEQVVGHKIMEFAHPDYHDDWRFLQDRLWHHKLPSFALETCLVRTDGSSFWCQVTSTRFPDGGEELGYTQLEDISDRKALEFSLKRLYDAQETVLHLVSHDLKAPIGHVQLAAGLLQSQLEAAQLAPGQVPDAARYLTLIQRACADANKLLQDILLLGSLDANQLKLYPTDLGALLAQRLEPHRLVAHDKGLTLTLAVPPEPLLANLNADIFGRVIDNLVSNALKFTPAGGHITVALSRHADQVRLLVRDTGIGIPKELQEDLFEKFSAAARTGVGGEASTGLGLFISRHIVLQHRGKIWVESEEGAGTSFFVELN